jgi:hypothetical protein
VNAFAGIQIENFDCLMHLGSNKYAMAFEIDRPVVEVACKTG